ncbi:hypothetical protein FPSE_02778 [Fusarium pseudograminearum CS3096]|uniref:ATP-dependent DNA ligase family profile domain-containing protein n=1 Tax=Fusarium pseudograminearum (strain CS3096) TaxID=1028729 RepID=K3VQ57_FUSPC|nr:hypothetical protein FPSE_02778 [Fusarium pseudograminearum CS3096]EKJ77134.1 hypothetical protein FPSE_02778 [Fusarium pseudograminearum CS3096]
MNSCVLDLILFGKGSANKRSSRCPDRVFISLIHHWLFFEMKKMIQDAAHLSELLLGCMGGIALLVVELRSTFTSSSTHNSTKFRGGQTTYPSANHVILRQGRVCKEEDAADTLERIIGRACLLGASRIAELARYRQPGSGVDLADCVHRILTITPSPGYSQRGLVTVEEIDELLHSLASKVRWSSPSIRASQASMTPTNRTDVELMYRRLSAVEAKWFTRLVLKSYQPLVLDPHLIYRLCDPLLPCVLRVQDDFATAITTTQTLRRRLLPNPGQQTPREQIMGTVKPQLGIKIGRQPWIKGRSIKHCLDMGHGSMSVEEKIDGEYCQIHIDPSKGDRCIQIFSKSGKDSTEDRVALHGTILESLKIGQPDARVTKGCILEGELVVYDDYQNKILPFDKIRKHVSRRGWAELVPRQVVDFGQPLGVSTLRKTFALTILARKEGLVLKPDEPYFDFKDQRRKFSSCCIKLKKEYIGSFGDVGDFAVVGAKYDSAKAISYRIPGLKWTHFYVGCLDNREAVRNWKVKPEFTIVNVVELNETLLREVVTYSNPEPVAPRDNEAIILKQAPGVEQGSPPTAIFTKPLVFDLKCFSFDRVGNTGFWSLRFPSVTKVHFDRDFTDTISFEQLQELAKDATTAATLEDSQENLQWIAKLEAADPRGIAVDAASQLTMTTMPTPSPRKSTQNTTSTWSPTSPLTTRSPAGNIDSPCRDRVERFRPLILSTAVATLPTPAAPLDSFTRQRAKQKRDPLIIEPAPPHKRPKLDTESLPKDKHPLDSATSFQPRLPLTCVNDNSQSQPVMITCASPSTSVSLDDPDSDENDAPDSILCVNPEHSSPSGNDLETDAELHRDIPVNTIVSTGTKGCIYAGEDCAFAKTDVLISPGLLSNPTAKTLIELHGIENPVEHLDAWLEQEKSDKLRETGISSTMIFLLCQSDDKEATKSLFDKIQKVRESIPHRLQNWIHVYDWRVLQHVTIQEDATIQPKYYDGFHTPWQRWRIGTGLI